MGLSATYQPRKNLKLKWMLSRFNDTEEENKDITAAYLFGERDFDKSKASYGLIVNPLGAGVYQNWARNTLNIENWNVFSTKNLKTKSLLFTMFSLIILHSENTICFLVTGFVKSNASPHRIFLLSK